jgi:hypothetical protein
MLGATIDQSPNARPPSTSASMTERCGYSSDRCMSPSGPTARMTTGPSGQRPRVRPRTWKGKVSVPSRSTVRTRSSWPTTCSSAAGIWSKTRTASGARQRVETRISPLTTSPTPIVGGSSRSTATSRGEGRASASTIAAMTRTAAASMPAIRPPGMKSSSQSGDASATTAAKRRVGR